MTHDTAVNDKGMNVAPSDFIKLSDMFFLI